MSHCVEYFCSTMDGWERNGSQSSSSSRPRTAGVPVGVSKRSTKIAKNAKRSSGVLHQASRQQQQQQQQEAQPPPVYNINKSEFRNVVQRLTGSPVAEPLSVAPLASAEPPRGPCSRLQKMRPPPLSSLSAPPPPRPLGGVATPPLFSPLPPLTPGDAVWANPAESPVSAYMRYLQQSMSNPSPRPPNHPLPSPSAQFLLPSPLPSPGPAFPFVGAYFTQSPSAQFGFPGAGSPLLPPPPPSPGLLFPLSPAGRFPASPAAGFGREGFSFPDRNRRL